MTMTYEQRRNRADFPFSGIPPFLRAPICTDLDELDGDIAVMGAPTDEGSTFMGGSRFGPRALREHSLRFAGGGGAGYYDPETRREYLVYEMENNRITDLAPLAELSRLNLLHLGGNPIASLAPLAGLTELEVFYLSSSKVHDLSPLSKLTRMRILGLPGN